MQRRWSVLAAGMAASLVFLACGRERGTILTPSYPPDVTVKLFQEGTIYDDGDPIFMGGGLSFLDGHHSSLT